MTSTQAKRKKRATGPNKPITSELPEVRCEKLNCRSLIFNWNINGLHGLPEVQKKVLMQKIMEMPEDERKGAALSLLEVPGQNSFFSAAILVIKELGMKTNLGAIVSKAFGGRTYEECVAILKNAELTFDEDTLRMLKEFCDKKNGLPIELYQISI